MVEEGGGGGGFSRQGANLASLTDRWAGGGRTAEDDDRFICQSCSQFSTPIFGSMRENVPYIEIRIGLGKLMRD